MLDFLKISDKIRIKIEKACSELNATPMLISRYSNNEGDGHLYYVLAKRKLEGFDESNSYVLWLYNSSIEGLCNGVYMLSYCELMLEYAKRLNG